MTTPPAATRLGLQDEEVVFLPFAVNFIDGPFIGYGCEFTTAIAMMAFLVTELTPITRSLQYTFACMEHAVGTISCGMTRIVTRSPTIMAVIAIATP